MKKIKCIFLIIFLLSIVVSAQETKVGKELTLEEKVSIDKILENPEDFLGEKVLVEGVVTEVCPKMGCWMMVSDFASGNEIRVKVKDGEIVFPMEAVGGTAVVEGEVYKIELDEEEAKDYYEHIAEETGKEFDESVVKGPVTLYQIKGYGAELTLAPETKKDKTAE